MHATPKRSSQHREGPPGRPGWRLEGTAAHRRGLLPRTGAPRPHKREDTAGGNSVSHRGCHVRIRTHAVTQTRSAATSDDLLQGRGPPCSSIRKPWTIKSAPPDPRPTQPACEDSFQQRQWVDGRAKDRGQVRWLLGNNQRQRRNRGCRNEDAEATAGTRKTLRTC